MACSIKSLNLIFISRLDAPPIKKLIDIEGEKKPVFLTKVNHCDKYWVY